MIFSASGLGMCTKEKWSAVAEYGTMQQLECLNARTGLFGFAANDEKKSEAFGSCLVLF
jgi:hypothetical protein